MLENILHSKYHHSKYPILLYNTIYFNITVYKMLFSCFYNKLLLFVIFKIEIDLHNINLKMLYLCFYTHYKMSLNVKIVDKK